MEIEETRRRIHLDEIETNKLMVATQKYLGDAGVFSYIQSKYIKEASKVIVGSENNDYSGLQPHVVPMNCEAWEKSLKVCVAFLKMYKMTNTLETMRTEYNSIPRKTGFKQSTNLFEYFDELSTVSHDMGKLTFTKRVNTFVKTQNDVFNTTEDREVFSTPSAQSTQVKEDDEDSSQRKEKKSPRKLRRSRSQKNQSHVNQTPLYEDDGQPQEIDSPEKTPKHDENSDIDDDAPKQKQTRKKEEKQHNSDDDTQSSPTSATLQNPSTPDNDTDENQDETPRSKLKRKLKKRATQLISPTQSPL